MKNKLQELRWEKNWSQNQLVIRSGVSQSIISSIENNQLENPRVATALKLAKAFLTLFYIKVNTITIDYNGMIFHVRQIHTQIHTWIYYCYQI